MEYTVRHVTRFRYSAPITESAMELRMQPRSDGSQRCSAFELATDPPALVFSRPDYLGNTVHHFDIPGRHSALVITAQAVVSVTTPPLTAAVGSDAWDELDALVADSDVAEMIVPSTFARPTALLRRLANRLQIRRRDDPLTLLREINSAINRELVYTPQSTLVDSPIDHALSMGRGVCQDYAHIMLALVRELGIPARYVSGYLYHHRDGPQHLRADATHAWVEALLPGLGWIGFDPTNNTLVRDRHIRVAVGRDYADVPPTRGVYKGVASSELS
ncbi:MAG: transglutaminase family protein, partial [Chloroflexota bacterium]|nr:transglutaminase family protein [Chloroflexota bacterium]